MKTIQFFRSVPADLTNVLLTNADLDTLQTYIRVNLLLGVKELFIYFDGDLPERTLRRLNRNPRVSVTNMGPEFRSMNLKGVLKKQRFVYADAYRKCTTNWLGVCDVDELMVADEPLADFVAGIPASQSFVRAHSCEVVWGETANIDYPFSAQYVRSPLREDVAGQILQDLYGDAAGYFSESGMISHSDGKYLIRTGLDVAIGIHEVDPMPEVAEGVNSKSLRLVHFDVICFGHLIEKMVLRQRKKIPARQARKTMWEQLGQLSGKDRRDFFDQLFRLKQPALDRLTSHGAVAKLPQVWTVRRDGRDEQTADSIFRPRITYYRRRLLDAVKSLLFFRSN